MSGLALGAVPTHPPGPLIEVHRGALRAIELELGVEGWIGSLATDADVELPWEHDARHVFVLASDDDFVFEPPPGRTIALKFVAGSAESEDLRVHVERRDRAFNLPAGKVLRVQRELRFPGAEQD